MVPWSLNNFREEGSLTTKQTEQRSGKMKKKTLGEIKKIAYEVIKERYQEEGVEKIKITQMDLNRCWQIFTEIILKNGTRKKVTLDIEEGGDIETFNES